MKLKLSRLEQAAAECVRITPRSAAQAAKLLRQRIVASRDLRRDLADRFMEQNIAALIAVARGEHAAPSLGDHLAAKGQSFGTGAGHQEADTQTRSASAGSDGGGGQMLADAQVNTAAPSAPLPLPTAPKRRGPSPRVQAAVRSGLLDTYKVGDRVIGDMTGAELREAAQSSFHNAAFLVAVARNTPGNVVVRSRWTDDDLQQWHREAAMLMARGKALSPTIIEATKPDGYSEAPHA